MAGTVLDIGFKTAGRAHTHNRRHTERIADAFGLAHSIAGENLTQGICTLRSRFTQVPVFQGDKADA